MSDIFSPACRLCGESANQAVRAEYVFGDDGTHKFWECSACGAIYLYPPLDPSKEQEFYSKEFEKFMSLRSGKERDWSNAERHIETNQDQVKRRWPILEPYLQSEKSLLEIGCSSGFMLEAFRSMGMHCTGVEPSNVFIDFLRAKNYEVVSNIQSLESEGGRLFDLIVHFFVLEHMPNPYEFFQRQMALLKPGGIIIAEVPSATDPLTSLYKIPAFERFYWSIAHHFYYTPRSISGVLDKLGYDYSLIPEQRYDLSNHIVWMTEGRPGGQGRFSKVFSQDLTDYYKNELKAAWLCDTIFIIIYNNKSA